ncbi:unnamed protein product, partial [Iphiclides podalirius]
MRLLNYRRTSTLAKTPNCKSIVEVYDQGKYGSYWSIHTRGCPDEAFNCLISHGLVSRERRPYDLAAV